MQGLTATLLPPYFCLSPAKTPSPSATLGAGEASTRKRKLNHQIPIKPRKKQGGGGKCRGLNSPDPSAPAFLSQLLFQRVFQGEMATVVVLVATISGCTLYPSLSCSLDAPGIPFPNPSSQPASTTPRRDAPSTYGLSGSTTPSSQRWVLWEAWKPLSDRC